MISFFLNFNIRVTTLAWIVIGAMLFGCYNDKKSFDEDIRDYLLGKQYLEEDSINKAIYHFNNAENIFKTLKDSAKQINCLKFLSDCYRVKGNYKEARIAINNAKMLANSYCLTSESLYISIIQSEGLIYYQTSKYDSAQAIIENAIKQVPKSKLYSDSLNASLYQVLGVIFYQTSNFVRAFDCFQKAINYHDLPGNTNLNELSNCYLGAGLSLKRLGNTADCYHYLIKAFTSNQKSKKLITKTVCDLYIAFSSTLLELGYFRDSQLYLDTAESLIPNNDYTFLNEKRLIYSKRGVYYLQTGDYQKAFNYFTESYNFSLKLEHNKQYLDDIYHYQGNCEYYRGNFNSALKYYNQSLNLKERNNTTGIADIFNGKALCFKDLKINDSATLYYYLAITKRLQTKPINQTSLAKDYLNLGSFYLTIYKYEFALYYFQKALDSFRFAYGLRHPEVANCLMKIALYYERTGRIEKSLDFYQKALIANSRKFNDRNYANFPPIEDEYSDIVHINILKSKANALKIYFERNQSKNIPYYIVSLQCYEQIAKIINQLSVSYLEQTSQSFLAKKEKGTYILGIQTALDIYKLTTDPKYNQRAFALAENSNAAIYRASISSNSAMRWQGIPDSIIESEHQISSFLIASRVSLENERKVTIPNKNRIQYLEEECFKYQDKQTSLINKIEREFPEYYKIKYSMNSPQSKDIQSQLKKDQALVKYVVYDSLLISFVFSNDKFIVLNNIIDKEHLSDLNFYLNHIQNYSPGKSQADLFKEFLRTSYCLYQHLVKPVLDRTSCKNLIIIPDEILALLPFESLLTQDLSQVTSFKRLPYLIRTTSISYSINSTHAFNNSEKKDLRLGTMLAFAPFSKTELEDSLALAKPVQIYSKLSPLPFATEEAENAVSIFGGEVLKGKNATKKSFIERSSHYNIIHLATHAFADKSGRGQPSLYFYPSNENNQDDVLLANELPGINLNAQMIVLSSCNSGNGEMINGTGVLSMAHSFSCSGCPSVITTLWSSNDRSSSEIMKYFYEGLKKGMSKSEALKKAKLQYLDIADPLFAHPYYWAGIVEFGNDSPIISKKISGEFLLKTYFYICIASIVIIFLLRRKTY